MRGIHRLALLTIWASGAPLAIASTGVAVYRVLCFWLPLPSALASLPVLRETTRRAVPGKRYRDRMGGTGGGGMDCECGQARLA